MPDIPTTSAANVITTILVKIPKVQQWLYKPAMKFTWASYDIKGVDGKIVNFEGFRVTNSGMRAAIITEARFEMGIELLNSGGSVTHDPLSCISQYSGVQLSTALPCRLESGEFLHRYYELSELVEACQRHGKQGVLANFRPIVRDSLGNSYTIKSWASFEAPNKVTIRDIPGRGYITPEAYAALHCKRMRRTRLKRFCRKLIGKATPTTRRSL